MLDLALASGSTKQHHSRHSFWTGLVDNDTICGRSEDCRLGIFVAVIALFMPISIWCLYCFCRGNSNYRNKRNSNNNKGRRRCRRGAQQISTTDDDDHDYVDDNVDDFKEYENGNDSYDDDDNIDNDNSNHHEKFDHHEKVNDGVRSAGLQLQHLPASQ